MTDAPNKNAAEPSPEEYRALLLKERRRTVRTVRNTLLAIALLAGLWFLVLLAKERAAQNAPAPPEGTAAKNADGDEADRDFSLIKQDP